MAGCRGEAGHISQVKSELLGLKKVPNTPIVLRLGYL
jgi:hypothetical protein